MYSNVFKVHNSDMMYRTRCYIFFILFIRVVLCDDNRFFGVGDSGSDIVCYTNSSYALSWNEDLNTWEKGGIVTPDKQISVFDPVLKKNDLNCSRSLNENRFCLDSWTNYAWKYVNSIKNNLKEVILDKRWEDLEMYTTLGDNDKIQVTPVLDGNFIIPFSIRIKNNGHIFFCDDVKRSNCYWLTLQVLETNGKIFTCIRKCKRNSSGQSERCTANFNRNPKNYSTFLDGKLWRNFLLRKVKNQIIFSQGGPQQNTILNYTDYNSPYINVRYLFISSSNTTGLWKIHDYSYMNTDQVYRSIRLFESFQLPAYSLCISMYIRTCRFCILRLQLQKDYSLIQKPVDYVTSDSKWTEITFKVAGLTRPGPFHLLVSTVVEVYWHDSIQTFWSIGTVRTCQQNECRIIKTKNKAAVCQLMSEEPLIAYIPKTVNETCRLDQHSSCHPDNKSTNSNSKFSQSCVVSETYDITGNWTDLNDLIISWKHPNEVNGEITKFVIYLNNSEPIEIPIQPKNYNLTYSHTIKSSALNSSTLYGIQIATFNGIAGRKSEVKWLTSPPPLPHIDHEIICERDTQTAKLTLNVMLEIGSKLLIKIENVLSDAKSQICDEFELAVSCECGNSTNSYNIETLYLGQNNDNLACTDINNGPLDIEKNYRVAVILVNGFYNQTRQKCQIHDVGPSKTNKTLFALFIFPIIFLIVVIKIILKRNSLKFKEANGMALESQTSTTFAIRQPANSEIIKLNTTNNMKKNCHEFSNCIKIAEFEEYIRIALEDGSLEREHETLPCGQQKPCSYGALSMNKKKNRYKDILAYDHSRVVLQTLGSNESNYINANYIDGYQMPRAYIATQGPMKGTTEDFYQMIWQENVGNIVMVANHLENGAPKLNRYWPGIYETLSVGKFQVRYISHDNFVSYDFRIFILILNNETRMIQQWHFTCWPVHGFPLSSRTLKPFLQKIDKIPLNSSSPIVVHCSAGIERTGATLLCLISLRMAAKTGEIDPLQILASLRANRIDMINDINQYKLAHLLILQILEAKSLEIPCSQMAVRIPYLLKSGEVQRQFELLERTEWQDTVFSIGDTGSEPSLGVPKNPRSKGEHGQISSFINATYVNDSKTPKRFIVMQQPGNHAVGDFWRLIEENKVACIVNLNEIYQQNSTFWPVEANVVLNPVPDSISVKLQETKSYSHYDAITTNVVVHQKFKVPRKVIVLNMKNWHSWQDRPDIKDFLAFLLDFNRFSVNCSPIVVTCSDGVTASGLFVATSFIIERMKLEYMCDIYDVVRTIRYNQSKFISREIQFFFLYDVALQYLNEFEGYINMD